MESLGQLERELFVARNVASGIDIRNQIVLFNIDRIDLACSIDHDHAICFGVPGGNEAKLVCDLLSEQKSSCGYLIHVKESHFGDDKNNTILWACLHKHREVTGLLHLDISRSFDLLLIRSRSSYLHNVKLLSIVASLLLAEAENVVLVVSSVGHWHVGEASSETLKDLLLSLLDEEQLHVAANCLICSLVDTN